ncbi:ABC transporter ATP-binding protein [Streptomyces reniochalinae]|uniref:ABC transporter ATP-binding protein n=1 Tax=Streptomyces reniochalinae TaxID=2250578 RepID=A0A367EVV4_9ACTN|nr:ABC transporter ATP-binding protein [Streptomyces reniochalinae]RCG22258.1 ABC transporter ATP-binding protein [Streptomyces reniochalinae]
MTHTPGAPGRGSAPAQEHFPARGPRASRRQPAPAQRSGGPNAPADRLLLTEGRRHRWRTATLFVCATAAAGASLALPAALGHTLDLLLTGAGTGAGTGQGTGSTGTESTGVDGATASGMGMSGTGVGGWLAVCAALTCALIVLDAAETVLTGTLNSRTTARLRSRIAGHLLAVSPLRASRFSSGDLVTRCTGNAAHAGTGPAGAASALAALVTPVGGLVALALLDLRLAAVFAAGTPLLVLLLRAFSRTSTACVTRYQEAQARIAGRLVEALAGARTIAAAGIERQERARVLEPLADLSEHGHRTWRVQGRATAQAAVLVPLLQIAVVAVGGLLVGEGELSVGGLVAATRYAALAAGVGTLVGQLNALVRSRTAALRLAQVLAVPPLREGHRALPEATARSGGGRLELRGVHASYGDEPVLRDVDLVVPAGATVAVVGRSGSGKSLLAAVAGRLAEPEAGRVLLDGVDLADLTSAQLRRAVGFAFERPVLFGATVGEAIAAGVPAGHGPPGARVAHAAAMACADDFVRTLPHGYDTPREQAPLSGGEVQRVGLARAFAQDTRVLILDDATSSLDTVTELRVTRALTSAGEGAHTRLVVAHRASTAARADLTAWLEGGRIRAVAPHQHLWKTPAYRALFGSGADE